VGISKERLSARVRSLRSDEVNVIAVCPSEKSSCTKHRELQFMLLYSYPTAQTLILTVDVGWTILPTLHLIVHISTSYKFSSLL